MALVKLQGLQKLANLLTKRKADIIMYHKFDAKSNPRVQSLMMEKTASYILKQEFGNELVVPENCSRGLADIYIANLPNFPINIKFISDKHNSPFNLVSPTNALGHMFFNHIPTRMTDMMLSNQIHNENFSDEIKDIGFLIVAKESGHVCYMNLLNAWRVDVNAKNGFQVSLNNVSMNLDRTDMQSRNFLVDKYKQYLKKRAEPYIQWCSFETKNQQ